MLKIKDIIGDVEIMTQGEGSTYITKTTILSKPRTRITSVRHSTSETKARSTHCRQVRELNMMMLRLPRV